MHAIQISNVVIRQTENQLFNLNDLHKASGGSETHKPSNWLRNAQTKDVISELEIQGCIATEVINGGKNRGTYVCRELVIHYGMWISPKFSLEVIRTFLEVKEQARFDKTTQALPDGLTIEQQDEIKKLHRQLVQVAPKEQQAKLAITLWSAVKAKFGVSYKEVAPEHYLEVMSLMARVAVEKGVLYGEVLDKEQPTPINKDYFSHLAKMTHYATEFEKIQSMMCQSQFSEESKQFLTSLNWRVNNGAGYLFVFKPDIHNDIKQAFDFLRQQSQLCV